MSSTAPTKKPYRKAPPQHREVRHEPPGAREEVLEQPSSQDPVSEADRIHFLQHQNDELRRRLAYTATKMEAMEHEVDASRHYLEVELSRNREELEKLKDKFRR
ncbi:hypothetical protein GDO78_014440 [Eleutherodactylus coqui]|nr:hypothetical protein GDO78_014440 [Eleutherodactylus coqui]